MSIDWGNAAVEAGIAVIALIGGLKIKSGTHDEKFKTVFERLEKSDTRHEGHDEKFDALPTHYVPRTELEARLKGIEENGKDTKAMVQWLILYGHSAGTRQDVPPPPGISLPRL